jgi:hypothetical protein
VNVKKKGLDRVNGQPSVNRTVTERNSAMFRENVAHRDPLGQWIQAAYDPESPEAVESANRAKLAQLEIRLGMLTHEAEVAVVSKDWRQFDRLYLEFYRDDPTILSLMTGRLAAKAAVRQHRQRGKTR